MRRTLLAAVAVALLAAPSARAHPSYHYTGGCGASVAPDSNAGSQTTWTGQISAAVTATDAAGAPTMVPISVECQLHINGAFQGVFLSASGTGTAAGAAALSYQADPTDVVVLCAAVAIGGEVHVDCGPVTTGPQAFPPPPSTVSFGLGCSGGWTDYEVCPFQAPAGAFAASGYALPYAGPPGSTANLTVRVYVLVGVTPVTVGTCSNAGPGLAWCSVTIQATPYPSLPHFCEVTGVGNFGSFGCGDPPPLPGT